MSTTTKKTQSRQNGLNFANAVFKIEDFTVVRAVRDGLVNIIPVLIIGAFALILQTFPVEIYQNFIESFLGGFLLKLFQIVYSATFGMLSVYMAFSISRSYMQLKADDSIVSGGAPIASVLSLFILIGTNLSDFGTDCTGPKSMFLAIFTGLLASFLYLRLSRLITNKGKGRYLIGSDREFNRMLSTLFPISVVAVAFALFNALVTEVFDVNSFRELLIDVFNWFFSHGEVGFFKGFFFVMVSSVLWFFGIHGSDTLQGAMETYFVPGLQKNLDAVSAGGEPSVILTKEFFDCFVLMGGCGATICLLIAILIFSRNRAKRGLALTATFPMLFNINELMVFGLPIIFNPIMLIPFLSVPLVCYSVSYFAISSGLVPHIVSSVEWTTPVLLGGYRATDSVNGLLLQLVNIIIGVLIYLPFVRILDRQAEETAKNRYESFLAYYKGNEQALASVRLTEMSSSFGRYAKDLCNDLRFGLNDHVVLAYQPQFNYDGVCVGAEALLRWEHPLLGVLYPPLVIKLAEEGGFMADLEEKILTRALKDRPKVLSKFGENVTLSVNVSGTTVVSSRFIQFCRRIDDAQPFSGRNICLEVTERATIAFDDDTLGALGKLRGMGLALAIDDFSMGQTSLRYLKDSLFDVIKLDGSLVAGVAANNNVRDIISSLTGLAGSLGLSVVAEFVDSDEKKEALHELGCDCYQGYLFSPAVFLENDEK